MVDKKRQQYIPFILAQWKANFASAMEYKISFLTQVVFMILNNSAFILFWVFLFQNFTDLSGYGQNDMILLFGLAATSFGLMAVFIGNWRRLIEIIINGELDYYLALPKDELVHALISRTSFSGVGDILFGIAIFFIFGHVTLLNTGLYMLFSLTGMIIWLSLMIIVQSISFFFGNSNGFSKIMESLTMSLTSYPGHVYSAAFKTIFLFVVPVLFITFVPLTILTTFSWLWLVGTLLVAAITLTLAVIIFKRGVKKYESGNLMTAKI